MLAWQGHLAVKSLPFRAMSDVKEKARRMKRIQCGGLARKESIYWLLLNMAI
jgi:hypothetical protein